MVVDSMCSILSTVVVRMRSKPVVNRPSISSGFRPVNCQATATTGILIFGKISVGVRWIITGLISRINSARTINVYGRLRATLTIHILLSPRDYLAERSAREQNRARSDLMITSLSAYDALWASDVPES